MCLFAFTFMMIQGEDQKSNGILIRKFWLPTLALITALVWINQYIQVVKKPDVSRIVANQLRASWKETDQLYTNDKNIIYYLLRTKPPTRYIHTSVLYQPDLIRAYHVDVKKELMLIVDQGMDYYLLNANIHPILAADLQKNFQLYAEYPGTIKLYHRVSPAE
jgi:hypothetical protein